MAAAAPPPAPQTLLHYTAAPDPQQSPQLLGTGGFASTYKYTDSRSKLAVAIKRIQLTRLNPLKAAQLQQAVERE
jgi:hypothetical protein